MKTPMNSLPQIVLGAAVSVLVMRRRSAMWKTPLPVAQAVGDSGPIAPALAWLGRRIRGEQLPASR